MDTSDVGYIFACMFVENREYRDSLKVVGEIKGVSVFPVKIYNRGVKRIVRW